MYERCFMRNLLLLAVVLCIITAPAFPQASTGTVSGTVRDQTGAVIPGATVTLTHTSTNVTSKTTTNNVGFYMFPGVIPGVYRISVEASGMQKFEGSLTVQVQQSAVVDVTLKVGQTATEVSVQDVTPLLALDNPALGATLERTRIEQLPINGRTITSLLQIVPGMEGTRAFGLRDFSFEFVLDGAPLADRYGYYTVPLRQPALESIQEFKVENNSSSAKFTRPTSIILTTRGGTNELHGSLFETFRNNAIGVARSRTDYYTKPPFLNRNEFGGSGGGPVYLPGLYNGKNRTFWFFTYEALRQIAYSTGSYALPTAAMRNGDMRGLVDANGNMQKIYDPWSTDPVTWSRQQISYNGQLNVIDPKLLNPLAKTLFDVTALPTTADNPNVAPNWYGPVPNWRRSWTISTRIDHRFTDKDQFYGRYTQGNYSSLNYFYSQPSLDWRRVPANSQSNFAPNKNFALSWVRTFSPTFFNEALASLSRQPWLNTIGDPSIVYADTLGLPNPFRSNLWPAITGGPFVGNGYNWWTFNATGQAYWYLNLDDNLTKIHGRHEFQFGGHYRYDWMDQLPQQQQVGGGHQWGATWTQLYDPSSSRTNPQATPFTGSPMANMFLGTMNQYSNHFVRGMFYARSEEGALYFQDNFRATSRLTLNLGMRWDYMPPFWEKNNAAVSFDMVQKAVVLGRSPEEFLQLGFSLPSIMNRFTQLGMKFETPQQAGLPYHLVGANYGNFGPRLGLAYRVGDGIKSFVIRAGYRISYFHLPLSSWSARMRSNAPMDAWFYRSWTQAAYSPDGIGSLAMRSIPTILAGVNSRDAVTLEDAKSLTPGSANVTFFPRTQPEGQVQDWNFTLEKEVMESTVVRVGYIGNHSEHLEQLYQFNNSTPAYIWYVTTGQPLPTGTYAAVGTKPYDRTLYDRLERWQNTGWGNSHGIQLELERRYSKGYAFQIFYVMDNNLAAGGQGYSGTSVIPELNMYLPGQIPLDIGQRNKLLNYQRDTSVPKHRVRWNWVVDLPFGKGKPLLGNAGGLLNRLVGGWQISGMGSLRSNYFSVPSSLFPTGVPIQLYGYKYPIQNCTSGTCYPGYLWWNGYIPAHQINSYDPVTGKPNGYMGIPPTYKPAVQPLWPYPTNYRSLNSTIDPLYPWYGTNTVWVPLANGTVQRTTWSGLEPLRQQYFPSVRQWSVDASAVKNIPINERFNFRFTADFFNVFNMPGNPNSVGSTGMLSTQSSGNSARQMQLTARLTW
jgi:hypothetical protein